VQTKRCLVRALRLLLLLALVLGSVGTAHASDDPRAAARSHFERGNELAGNGAYEAALAEFRQAYEKSPHFAVLYNVGLCYVALGRPVEAIEAFRKYLAEGRSEVPTARGDEIEAQIATLEFRLAELSVTTDRPGARVLVDGRDVGQTPLAGPVRLSAGKHDVSASLEGAPTASRTVELREAERRTVDFTFALSAEGPTPQSSPDAAPKAAPSRILAQNPPERADSSESGPYRTLGYALAGAGAVVGGGALAHYFWNQGRHDDWEAEHARLGNGPTAPGYYDRVVANNERAASIERASGVTVGLFVASGTLLAGGVTLIVVDPGSGASVAWSGRW
jgi:tetratricopeptide (TPR) repeat protein